MTRLTERTRADPTGITFHALTGTFPRGGGRRMSSRTDTCMSVELHARDTPFLYASFRSNCNIVTRRRKNSNVTYTREFLFAWSWSLHRGRCTTATVATMDNRELCRVNAKHTILQTRRCGCEIYDVYSRYNPFLQLVLSSLRGGKLDFSPGLKSGTDAMSLSMRAFRIARKDRLRATVIDRILFPCMRTMCHVKSIYIDVSRGNLSLRRFVVV